MVVMPDLGYQIQIFVTKHLAASILALDVARLDATNQTYLHEQGPGSLV